MTIENLNSGSLCYFVINVIFTPQNLLQVANCKSLEELAEFFQTKLTSMNQCVQLRDSMGDPAVQSMMSGLGRSLTELETILTLMRAEIRQRKVALATVDVSHYELSS